MSETWPAGAPYALCLTHDVDRIQKQLYHYLFYGAKHGLRTQLRSFRERLSGREPYWNFDRIMELEAGLGVRSTFLFLSESASGFGPEFWGRYEISQEKVKAVICALDRGGWEIGLHGSLLSYRDLDLLKREKDVLEDIVGRSVRSTRQHYLNLDEPGTWQIQRQIGLEVDSTLGFADRPWDCSRGVHPFYTGESGMLELPITLMDTIGLTDPGIRRDAERVVERVVRAGGLVVLDWHQRTYSPGEYVDAVDFYVSAIQEAKTRGAWIATMGAIADYWSSRKD